MPQILINTDGTLSGTKLSIDGKEVTKDFKVVDISFYASAPYKGKYSGETYQGGASCSFTMVDNEGKLERKSYGETDTAYVLGVGQKIKAEDQILRYVGAEVDSEVLTLVDKIISHCEKEKMVIPSKEKLLSRSISSLKDKIDDLGIKIDEVIK